ncbi:hypothetical protein HDU98_009693 [Podochytrium sp. JEL0797]|nr:hypothetical protein HDU98_009693 [Podochytrium sp. JEL0797]
MTIVLVHGFLGSADSFSGFPGDLQRSLLAKGTAARTLAFEFDSTGDNEHRVAELLSYLTSANTGITGNVALLGHSMGGLLCVDAARKLDEMQWSGFTVTHVVAFDSPFLGVHPTAIVASGGAKVAGHISSLSSMMAGNPGSSAGGARSLSSTGANGSSWAAWGALAVAGAAVATAAYSSPTMRDVVSKAVTSHASFLGPLWSPGDQNSRLKYLSKSRFRFVCFYLITTMLDPSSPSNTSVRRTFVSLPTDPVYLRFFQPIEYDSTRNPKGRECGDEIEAHMNMFRGVVIGEGVYQNVLKGAVAVICLKD